MVETERPDMPPRPPKGGVTGRGGQAMRKAGETLADQVQFEMGMFARDIGRMLDQVGMKTRHHVELTNDGIRFTFEASRGAWPEELPYPWAKPEDGKTNDDGD